MNNGMNNKTYLIIGGTGGIGQAMVKQLVQESAADQTDGASAKRHSTQVFATYHRSEPNFEAENLHWLPMNISDEDSIQKAADTIKQTMGHVDWVINCVGLLHTKTAQPEKALRQIETAFFLQNMQINALASLLIAKHIKPLLAKAKRSASHPAIFATISARVGSITDNQLGGWYSYRMSKAALNMGMQPGTVNTQLSAPFQGNVAEGHLFSPAYSAECLLEVLSGMTAAQSGSFVDWAGESIPW